MYSGDKVARCTCCGKNTRHERCSNCDGRGPTWMITCKFHCQNSGAGPGYKCENGRSDAYHPRRLDARRQPSVFN